MSKFIKKPITIEAIQITGSAENAREVSRFIQSPHGYGRKGDEFEFRLNTNHGRATATTGDWVIRGQAGEYYPCLDSVFRETYDAVIEA